MQLADALVTGNRPMDSAGTISWLYVTYRKLLKIYQLTTKHKMTPTTNIINISTSKHKMNKDRPLVLMIQEAVQCCCSKTM